MGERIVLWENSRERCSKGFQERVLELMKKGYDVQIIPYSGPTTLDRRDGRSIYGAKAISQELSVIESQTH